MSDENKAEGPHGPQDMPSDEALRRALEEVLGPRFRAARQSGNSLPPDAASPEDPCPEPSVWIRLAFGEIQGPISDASIAHAAHCSACAQRLRLSLAALWHEATSEETAELGLLQASTPEWQDRVAEQLARTSRRRTRTLPSKAWWSVSGIAAAVVVAVTLTMWWHAANAPERQLAEAYANARTFDLRIPGAGFAPVAPGMHLRGGDTNRESAKLLSARTQIERALERKPDDPHWLQLAARADLLEEQYGPAIDILDRLLAAGPATPALLTDDASAYFQRGIATGSENDRATALDNLRRADEMAPNDPVVLFNEAVVMEDRGQVMNAVETWHRYLNFERDPRWLEDGRRRLKALEEKLNRVKTHSSRMEQHLSSPQAMQALSSNPAQLAQVDEEMTSILLPGLIDAAFPLPVNRSRGSPCAERCQAARNLLRALAHSLEENHQDPWLTDLLPSASLPIGNPFSQAAHLLGAAIDADSRGAYNDGERWASASRAQFHSLANAAGENRAELERIYAMGRRSTLNACYTAAEALLPQVSRYPWIEAQDLILDVNCDISAGSSAATNPHAQQAIRLSHTHGLILTELRARNTLAELATESGNVEAAWRIHIETLRLFYQGDYPPFRAANVFGALSVLEDGTPRTQLSLLIHHEAFGLFSLSQNEPTLANQRVRLIRAAIRAGALDEANRLLAVAQEKWPLAASQKGLMGSQAEAEVALASLYLDRGDRASAGRLLDAAQNHMVGEDNPWQLRSYAEARGSLELALGHAQVAEQLLHNAILSEEMQARGPGHESAQVARENRELYAELAGVWLAQHRPGVDIAALWERYRLRILGEPVPACAQRQLDCLRPRLQEALARNLRPDSQAHLMGQIVLRDRVLLYRANAGGVEWTTINLQSADLLAAATTLEDVASSPASSQASVDQAGRRLGALLLQNLEPGDTLLMLEPDPLLGNVPWPAVETAAGPIGLHYALAEAPSILLKTSTAAAAVDAARPLVVGASVGAGQSVLLPEALREARAVAHFETNPNLLLALQATQPAVAQRLSSAPFIHFAGHAVQSGGSTRLLLAPSNAPGDTPYLDRRFFLKDPPRAARLIVFSACATGKRDAGWNHGMGDIVDTLASLGVPDVVATRWQIDSESAVPMMDAFYSGLAGGLSVPQSLTAARQSLIRDARYKHPYYWAAYYASGVGNSQLHEDFHGNKD